MNVIAWAIQGHPRSKYRHFKREFSLTKKEPKSRLEFSKSVNTKFKKRFRCAIGMGMGLEGRQITGFQLKIRNPWRYKVWPKVWPDSGRFGADFRFVKQNIWHSTVLCCIPLENLLFDRSQFRQYAVDHFASSADIVYLSPSISTHCHFKMSSSYFKF